MGRDSTYSSAQINKRSTPVKFTICRSSRQIAEKSGPGRSDETLILASKQSLINVERQLGRS
jgi:hypothetical protein